MAGEIGWTFEVNAPLAAFDASLRHRLVERGFRILQAQVYDFCAERAGVRIFVKLSAADEGVRVTAKPKPGFLQDDKPLTSLLWAACRDAQLDEWRRRQQMRGDL